YMIRHQGPPSQTWRTFLWILMQHRQHNRRVAPGTKPAVFGCWGESRDRGVGGVMSAVHEAPALSDIDRPWEREMAVRVMTGYVAHELNHPLGTIINLANILSRRLVCPVVRSKDISEHVKNIKAEAIRATSIIKNMRMLTEHKPPARES